MPDLPSGIVTFLFTDIEGSTKLWESDAARMAEALARHDELCRATVEAHDGWLIKMIGDGLHAVFGDPAAAVGTVLDLQRGMATIAADCGIAFKMRCGLHAGAAQERDGDYFGSAVNRAARDHERGARRAGPPFAKRGRAWERALSRRRRPHASRPCPPA